MAIIVEVVVFKTDIPFRAAFGHAGATRSASESVFVKIRLDEGTCGFGESLPRVYVTGNTQDGVFRKLVEFAPRLIGRDLSDTQASLAFIKDLPGIEAEARCAMEMALLDGLGRTRGIPVADLLGAPPASEFTYSAIISGASLLKTFLISVRANYHRYAFVKVKTGYPNDMKRVRLVRALMPRADIRIDANGAWERASALKSIEALRPFAISCVEQPVAKEDVAGMRDLALRLSEPVMADESLCTVGEARELAQTGACDLFNVRLSKCGGVFRSLAIIAIAEEAGLGYQIGCHVGETGLLSAAGRCLARCAPRHIYLEGSLSRLLLREDVIREDITPRMSRAGDLPGPGFGVTVREGVIRKYSQEVRSTA